MSVTDSCSENKNCKFEPEHFRNILVALSRIEKSENWQLRGVFIMVNGAIGVAVGVKCSMLQRRETAKLQRRHKIQES